MQKTFRQKFGMVMLVVGLTAYASPASASSFVFQFIDNDDAVGLRGLTYRDGVLIQDVNVGPESYGGGYGLWDFAVLISDFDIRLNIFDPDGVTLSDTWRIFGTTGSSSFGIPFCSDTEEASCSLLPDALSLIETGDLQTVFAFNVVNPDGSLSDYTLQFVSDVEASPVPEPTTFVLLGSGLVVAAWRRRRSQATKSV